MGLNLRRDRYAGCLVGKALGDALGFLVEGRSPKDCQHFVDRFLLSERVFKFQKGPFSFGQYSDDTQLARELMQSFVLCKGFNASDFGKRVARIFTEELIVGRGRATWNAAKRLASGVPADKAGEPAPAAGNGSAMRAAVVGLFFAEDLPQVATVARVQGEVTHKDRRASAGAIAMAVGSALLLNKDTVDADAFVAEVASHCESTDQDFSASLLKLREWIRLPTSEAVQLIQKEGKDPDYKETWWGISPFVTGSVLWAYYSFLRHPRNYMGTVKEAIAVGGDVDTTAAMAGALSGAFLGLNAIPEDYRNTLNDQGVWTLTDLVTLSERCFDLVHS
ncbi:MAG: ADP-ribosylglycohydrolase family protein [Planctomycetota bacterium]|nr:ADP-ribosylglycohydrolase family protein [Planctomycetota bacterium]